MTSHFVEVPDKEHGMRNRDETASRLLGCVRRSIEVPEILDLMRIEPGFYGSQNQQVSSSILL